MSRTRIDEHTGPGSLAHEMAQGMFKGRRGHGGGACTKRVLSPEELEAFAVLVLEKAARDSAPRAALEAENARLHESRQQAHAVRDRMARERDVALASEKALERKLDEAEADIRRLTRTLRDTLAEKADAEADHAASSPEDAG